MDLFANKNKSLKSTEEIADYEIRQIGKTKLLFDFKKDCTFKHGDKLTKLIKARMIDDYEKNECIAPDTAKYICFEIPTYLSINNLAQDKIFDILNQIGKFEDLMNKNYNNIGLIDRIDERYELFKPTGEVLAYTRDKLDKEINETGQMFSKRLQRRKFKEELVVPATEYIEANKEKREKRKENPYLEEQLRYKKGDKIFTDYEGIDLIEGKILEINELEKIDKEEDTILYFAYIQKRNNDDRKELKSLDVIPNGNPVMFTTQMEIEEFQKEENKEKMKKLLELLSSIPLQELNNGEIQYIGGIDDNGLIDKSKENYPEKIKTLIEERKKHFKKDKTKEEEKTI